jgi:hypothetical protein
VWSKPFCDEFASLGVIERNRPHTSPGPILDPITCDPDVSPKQRRDSPRHCDHNANPEGQSPAGMFLQQGRETCQTSCTQDCEKKARRTMIEFRRQKIPQIPQPFHLALSVPMLVDLKK